MASYTNGFQPNAAAGPSDATRYANPQLGPEPWFTYPTPTSEELDNELPPYEYAFENEDVGLSDILHRLTVKGHEDLVKLTGETLSSAALQHRPRQIIDFAKHQRQSFLKYLAILRWKTAVDVPFAASGPSNATTNTQNNPFPFLTPQTNGSIDSTSNSPAAGYAGKGKGRATEEDERPVIPARGRLTDARRLIELLHHQNAQHDDVLKHLEEVIRIIEKQRDRNPDLLTAISVLSAGTYTRFPTAITETFKHVPRLTNRTILRTLRRLNRHILYRLRCADYLPAELFIESVRDGKVYFGAGGEHGWKAHMTVVGFGEGDDARWWLTGVEWGWKAAQRGTDDPGGARKLSEDERQQILDVVNHEILPPRPVPDTDDMDSDTEKVDSPLVRLFNFLQHLSLSYQLETLCSQAVELSQGKWRGQLLVNLDRGSKTLRARYWIRPRPLQQPIPQGPPGKRVALPPPPGSSQPPLIGGTLSIALEETEAKEERLEDIMRSATVGDTEPSERILKLGLSVKWEAGEGGAGGGIKAGDVMDPVGLRIDSGRLDFANILYTATRTHAAHLTRFLTTPLLSSPRLALFPLNLPSVVERDEGTTPVSFRIPLPSRQKPSALVVSVSAMTGLVEIEDESANESRASRARLASVEANKPPGRLLDSLVRLVTAVVAENLESQMRQLGWTPSRRLPLRSADLTKNDLHPASCIYVPLPTSSSHYFMAKIGLEGVTFELLKLSRVPADNGVGTKLSIGDRSPMDLARLRMRRQERAAARSKNGQSTPDFAIPASNFEADNRDLKDLFVFCNGLVAQTIVEQQLKDRSIPYSLKYPPATGETAEAGAAKSTSAVAGMIPTIEVDVHDLLRDRRASDVANPKVLIQLKDWWNGGKCKVSTVVQLRHKPALSSSGGTPNDSSGPTVKDEGISFDQASSTVRFSADDISRCVPAFLEQWERLSKVIVVAGEVDRLNKSGSFDDLRMISFDLRTALFTYAKGHTASITYTPQDDSYMVSFESADGESPHEILAPLLSHRLNELAGGPKNVVKGSTGKQFLSLLCNTLPFLLEVDALRSTGGHITHLVIRSVSQYRLLWDIQNTRRYAVDVRLIGDQYLFSDGSSSSDPSCGPITSLPTWNGVLKKTYEALKAKKEETEGRGPAVLVDGGKGLICDVVSVRDVVRSVVEQVKTSIAV